MSGWIRGNGGFIVEIVLVTLSKLLVAPIGKHRYNSKFNKPEFIDS